VAQVLKRTTTTAASQTTGGSLVERWLAYLTTRIDGASLALFRICFGLIMLWEVWRYFTKGWIPRYYIDPTFYFSYLPFVQPWPGEGMYWHFFALGVLAVFIALGLYYRVAASLFFLGFTYVFLLDKTQYLNHFYLISLLSLMMAIIPVHRTWSLDAAWRGRGGGGSVPRWSLHTLRAHIVIVYFFGGIAKLNPDWLRGEPMGSWLLARADMPILGALFALPFAGLLFAYGGLLIDLTIGFILLWRRTFWLGVLMAIVFNLLNAMIFQIGIFPFFMLGALALFPRPDWPRLLFNRSKSQGAGVGGQGSRVRGQGSGTFDMSTSVTATTRLGPGRRWNASLVIVALLHVYLLAHLALPLRHWIYPGDVNWTEEGHRFSWRMMLREKDVDFMMTATNPQTGERWEVNAYDWLTRRQYGKMVARPDMIHQFAHHVADTYERDTGVRPIINVRAYASLNGNPPRDMIDPAVDLAAQPWSLGPAPWIKRG
jgi:hypothetical protein